MCAHLPPPETPRRGAPPSPPPPSPQSPGSHTLNSSHWALAWDAGSAGCIASAGHLIGPLGGLLGDMLEAGWWRAGVNPQGDGYTGLGI
jgi:hypothetical protein